MSFFKETIVRGRGEDVASCKKASAWSFARRTSEPQYDKNRYHFFKPLDGKKRYYRVGQPWFSAVSIHSESNSLAFFYPGGRSKRDSPRESGNRNDLLTDALAAICLSKIALFAAGEVFD